MDAHAFKLNTPVTIEVPVNAGSVLTCGYVWGKPSAGGQVPVRLALAPEDPILCYPCQQLRVMPMNQAVTNVFRSLCARDNLEGLARIAGRSTTPQGLTLIIETIKKACAYRTERSPAGGRMLDAAASELLSMLHADGAPTVRRTGRKRQRTAGTEACGSADEEQAEPPEEITSQQEPQQPSLRPTPQSPEAPRASECTDEHGPLEEVVDEEDEELPLPVVCRQVSLRTLTLAHCLGALRDGVGQAASPTVYVPVPSASAHIAGTAPTSRRAVVSHTPQNTPQRGARLRTVLHAA